MRKERLIQIVLVGGLIVGVLNFGARAYADDAAQLKDQVKALQERVDQLETQLGNKQPALQTAVVQPAVIAQVPVPAYNQWDDPFSQMMRMQAQMDRNMHQAFAESAVFNPKMDINQAKDKYIISMDIPGMDKDKINVEIKEGLLVISGERRSEAQDNNNNQYYRQERSFGTFTQVIPLPEDAKKDEIEAIYKNGVLIVSVGRMTKEEKKQENEKILVK